MNGPVTTARAEVDCVVTDWGVAWLCGLALRRRALALAGIADLQHRDARLAAVQAVQG